LLARHRSLDLATLRRVERAMMERDRQGVLVDVQSSWNSISAWLRVLTKISVVRCGA
jgi:hypothetical protein